MRTATILIALAWPLVASAQLDVPVPIILDGAQPDLRQVMGLAEPSSTDAAISVASQRKQASTLGVAMGSTVLTVDLDPPLTSYTAGMSVVIVPLNTNMAGAQLDINALGPVPMLKDSGMPLDSADLVPNVPVRLVHDGTHFRVISDIALPCRSGYSAPNRNYCISDSSYLPMTFFEASDHCHARNARLCTIGEWINACLEHDWTAALSSGAEWVDHAANHSSDAKVMGNGFDGTTTTPGIGCQYGGTSAPNSMHRFRCCMNR